ncbi:Pro-Pol polyprotein [Dictyocoela muelleri]|nr:Pro-Pol polyprotein [Dictyocoela muelleri]
MKKFNIKHIKSAPHNPSRSSIIYRINKEIGIVLRISRGLKLTKLKKNICTRLNLNISISTGYAPYEIFFKKSIFKNKNENILIRDNEIVERLKRRINKRNLTIQRKRKNIYYAPGTLIYHKNNSPDEVVPKWKEPYKVIRMSNGKNNLYVDKGNKIERISVNNVRPYRGGERM